MGLMRASERAGKKERLWRRRQHLQPDKPNNCVPWRSLIVSRRAEQTVEVQPKSNLFLFIGGLFLSHSSWNFNRVEANLSPIWNLPLSRHHLHLHHHRQLHRFAAPHLRSKSFENKLQKREIIMLRLMARLASRTRWSLAHSFWFCLSRPSGAVTVKIREPWLKNNDSRRGKMKNNLSNAPQMSYHCSPHSVDSHSFSNAPLKLMELIMKRMIASIVCCCCCHYNWHRSGCSEWAAKEQE